MTFKFACPHCGQRIAVSKDEAGTNGACPRCGHSLIVPNPSSSSPPVAGRGQKGPRDTRLAWFGAIAVIVVAVLVVSGFYLTRVTSADAILRPTDESPSLAARESGAAESPTPAEPLSPERQRQLEAETQRAQARAKVIESIAHAEALRRKEFELQLGGKFGLYVIVAIVATLGIPVGLMVLAVWIFIRQPARRPFVASIFTIIALLAAFGWFGNKAGIDFTSSEAMTAQRVAQTEARIQPALEADRKAGRAGSCSNCKKQIPANSSPCPYCRKSLRWKEVHIMRW